MELASRLVVRFVQDATGVDGPKHAFGHEWNFFRVVEGAHAWVGLSVPLAHEVQRC